MRLETTALAFHPEITQNHIGLKSAADGRQKIAIIGAVENTWASTVFNALRQRTTDDFYFEELQHFCSANSTTNLEGCIYIPRFADQDGLMPDLSEAENLFRFSAKF